MAAMNKRLGNLTWPDKDKTREQLEAIRELAKELHADYPTDTADEPTNWSNEARNRRNAYIRAQFLKDENGVTLHLLNGSEWLELFDLLGFSVDKETRKRFASHLKWYSFWYADFKPRLSSKYAQRIHWYVHNFLFCLRNKLQTEKEYREGKYGSKGQAYFMGIEQQPATPAETPRISKETAETVNVSAEGGNKAETQEIGRKPEGREAVCRLAPAWAAKKSLKYGYTLYGFNLYPNGEFSISVENGKGCRILTKDEFRKLCSEPPQSPETPQAVECTTDSDCRVCSHCGKHFHEGYFLGDEYACSEECAVALYGGDRELFEADLEAEEEEAGATECYWTTW